MLIPQSEHWRTREETMFEVSIQNLGDVTIFHCKGRLTFGDEDTLLNAVSSQQRLRLAVLDLAEVTAVDAAGLGMLVSLRNWARSRGVALKLMNLTPWVQDSLELTKLKSAFEICSVPEMLRLLCRALDQAKLGDLDGPVESPREVDEDAQRAFA
jgi:anti-anti-sigma factor